MIPFRYWWPAVPKMSVAGWNFCDPDHCTRLTWFFTMGWYSKNVWHVWAQENRWRVIVISRGNRWQAKRKEGYMEKNSYGSADKNSEDMWHVRGRMRIVDVPASFQQSWNSWVTSKLPQVGMGEICRLWQLTIVRRLGVVLRMVDYVLSSRGAR